MSPSGAEPARRWRNSAVHREVDSRHARWIWKVVLGAAIALTPVAVYLLQTMSYVQTSYALEELRGREQKLVEAERRLRIEKALLESLPAVEARAGKGLGLEHPPASHVVVVAPGDIRRPLPLGTPTSRPQPR